MAGDDGWCARVQVGQERYLIRRLGGGVRFPCAFCEVAYGDFGLRRLV